jgi:hypothetical protein
VMRHAGDNRLVGALRKTMPVITSCRKPGLPTRRQAVLPEIVARTSRSLGLPYDSLVVGKRLRKLRLKCGSVESRDNVENELLAGAVMIVDTF